MALVRPSCSGCGYSGCQSSSCGYSGCPGSNCGCNARASGCSSPANNCSIGALNAVSGPYVRESLSGCSCYPYYTGPCGPTQRCNCCCCPSLPWPPLLPPCCELNALPSNSVTPLSDGSGVSTASSSVGFNSMRNFGASATFTAAAPLTVNADANVPLTLVNGDTLAYSPSQGGVLIRCPGIYLVFYTVHIPANQTISSSFSLELNGEALPSSTQTIGTASDSATSGSTVHTLVQASSGSLLTLNPSATVNLSGASSTPNVFTLTIVRLA